MTKTFPDPMTYPPYPTCCNKEMGLDYRAKPSFVCFSCDRHLLVEDHYANVRANSTSYESDEIREENRQLRVALEVCQEELREAARTIATLKADRNGILDAWGGS